MDSIMASLNVKKLQEMNQAQLAQAAKGGARIMLDRHVPMWAKLGMAIILIVSAYVYLVLPGGGVVDVVPDFIPVLGTADDGAVFSPIVVLWLFNWFRLRGAKMVIDRMMNMAAAYEAEQAQQEPVAPQGSPHMKPGSVPVRRER